MYKIAVIGAYDSIYGFAALGMHIFPVSEAKDGGRMIRKLAEDGYGIIYITEDVAAENLHEIDKYREQMIPAIIQIPGITGNTGAGVLGVKQSVEQAVGSDIVFGNP